MKKTNLQKGAITLASILATAGAFLAGLFGINSTQNQNVGDGINTIQPLPFRAKVSSNDTTAGFLNGKLVAGANITLTENNDGANETLTIASTGGGGGGTPCTTTALSIQYNAAGSFGCVSGVTSNGSTLTAKDANLEIVDDGDTTKKLAVQASTITTGTTRTVTALNSSGIWALTNAALTTANWVPYTNSSGVFLGSNGLQYDPTAFTLQVGANGTGTGIVNVVKSDGTVNAKLTSDNTGDSFINSDLGLGQSTATARLEIAAGTTSKAPLQLNSGTNLTTPVSGSIEYNGTNLFYTDSTPTRRTLVTLDNTQTLTNKTLTSPTIAKIANLTTNGFVKTSAGDGTLSVDTSTYLTGNQTITLSGDVSGSGSTAITTAIGTDKVTEPMLKVVDTPVDEECLTYEATGGDFEWQTCGSGGGSPGGSGSELQFRGGASTFSAVSGSSVTANGYMTLAPTASTSGSPTLFTLTGPAHTTLAASTEAPDVNFNLARTVQFAAGAITNQRAFQIQAPTYGFASASTITNAATFYVSGNPVAGTNATITNNYAAFIGGTNSRIGSTTVGTTNAAVGGVGLEIGGNNNTTGGVNLSLANTNSGTSAFVDLFLQNDLANATGTHYAVVNLNSSTYSDTTFGTLLGVANQLHIYGTDGPTAIGTAKAGSWVSIFTDGTATANEVARFTKSTALLTPQVATTGSPNALKITGAAHTTLTASTEASDVFFSLARTVQFATGALTKQTAVNITAPTYSFVGASTISDAATLYINDAPGTGTNATITRKYALWADSGIIRGDNEFLGGNGSNTNPTFAFVSDTNTGIYRIAASRMGIAINGTGQIDISSTYIGGLGSNDFQIRHSNGLSSTVPTYSFFTSTTSGMGMSAANTLNFITNSVTAIEIGSAQLVGFGVSGATARVHITGSTTSAASLRIEAGTAPTSPNEGDMWADSTQKALVMFTDGIKQVSSGTIFTQTANTSVSATTTETTLLGSGVGTLTLPANFWKVGKTIRIKVTYSDIDTDTTPGTWTVRGKYGTTTIVSHAGTPTALQTNGTGDTEIILTCRTTGASGTIAGYVKTTYGYTGISQFIGTTTSTTTVDTTASGALNVTMQFGNSNAGNNITSTISTVEVLN